MGFNRVYPSDKIERLMVEEHVDDVMNIFKGNYDAASLGKFSRKRLESVVTRLVNITARSNGKKENYCRPKWWPEEIMFVQPLQDLKKVIPNPIWNQVLRRLVALCWEFYDKGYKKRKETVLREVHPQHFLPVVFLCDILKPSSEKTVCKDNFINSLNLVSVDNRVGGKQKPTPSASKPIRLAGLPNVPFSSDYAQALIKRDKACSLEEAHLKRLERNERYLNNDDKLSVCSSSSATTYPVSYDKKEELYCHIYKFPAKQAYQLQDRMAFLKSLCKPVTVVLERCDLKYRKKRVLKVVLNRLNVRSLQLRNRVCKRVF